MKRKGLTTLFILLAICSIQAQQGQLFDDRPKITANGEAVVKVQPDEIIITFGIETWDKNIMVAKQENNDIMKKAIVVIKEAGIQDKEIQTDYLSIEPRYDDNYEKKNFIGYFVRNTFVVTLAEPDKVEELVTGVLQSGVNYIHNINFQTTEFKKYREQARELALNAAKEKAEKMAGALGQRIGDPIQINEGYGGSNWWYYSSWNGWGYGGRSNYMSQNVMQNIESGTGEISETIALGKISIKANVTVTFELKN
ncbi:MAG: SIMPL domain-containing protein [Ignavibacteriaceae bacterium]